MMQRSSLLGGLIAGSLLFFLSGAAHALDDAALAATLDKRLSGDATGACLAAAVIQGDRVARAWRCADPADIDRIGPDVAFEIGSLAKPMAATLLADLILSGDALLDDPLSDHLPAGTEVPDHGGQPILLRHVVTHTSGLPRLPPGMQGADPDDPYAALDPAAVLDALAEVTLEHAPGTRYEYSNFAPMLLSLALARQAGMDFERLLDAKLFTPLGMEHAHINEQPPGVRVAAGHFPDGSVTAAWTVAGDLAGAVGVRATLDDMVRYARAQLGHVQAPIGAAIKLAQRPVRTGADQAMAMNWLLVPLSDHLIHAHEGGTGGFSSFLAFDLERERAVVVLADTALTQLGGLGDVGLHLLDDSLPLGGPRQAGQPVERPAVPPVLSAEALRAYAGTYALAPEFALVLRERGGALHAQATGQDEFALEAVAEDVFEAAAHGIEIRFSRSDDGAIRGLELHQGGHVATAARQ